MPVGTVNRQSHQTSAVPNVKPAVNDSVPTEAYIYVIVNMSCYIMITTTVFD